MKKELSKLLKYIQQDITEAKRFTRKRNWKYVHLNCFHAKESLQEIMTALESEGFVEVSK